MHREQLPQHLKSNNIISKLAVITLSIILLTGLALVPALQIGVNGQVQQQQQAPQQQNQVGSNSCSIDLSLSSISVISVLLRLLM